MLYQLSYSPNKLDDLEALFEGYTSAVRDEADVYPKRRNVARGQRKKASSAFFRVLFGCARNAREGPPAGRPPPAGRAPRASLARDRSSYSGARPSVREAVARAELERSSRSGRSVGA